MMKPEYSQIESNKKLVRELTQRVFNEHNPKAIEDYFSKDAKWHGGILGTVQGADNLVGFFASIFASIPDLKLVEQDIIADNRTVVIRAVVEGTHKATLLGVPATGNHLRWDAVDMYRIENGKITDDWAGDDWLAVFYYMGAYTPPGMQPPKR